MRLPPSLLDRRSIALRNWKLVDGSEKRRSAELHEQLKETEPQRAERRAPEHGLG